ncbi:MAG: hypothetical protein L0H31_15005, partial [Nocardioidaceae bacterium]|nr:hypothetical protein [Nocardioidaceae bacterium]
GTLAMPTSQLRDRRGAVGDTSEQVALQVLATAREQLNAELVRAINGAHRACQDSRPWHRRPSCVDHDPDRGDLQVAPT